MKSIHQPLKSIPGDFGKVSDTEFMLTTERGMYRVTLGGYSGLSGTERRSVSIETISGQPVTSFDYIRKHLKRGLKVNLVGLRGMPSFGTEAECAEAMSRHYVADFEAALPQAVAA